MTLNVRLTATEFLLQAISYERFLSFVGCFLLRVVTRPYKLRVKTVGHHHGERVVMW